MPRDKTASHEKIVDAAMREFQEKGYEQASMKAVADAVGMTSAALYRHFENKQDMFASLVQPFGMYRSFYLGRDEKQPARNAFG